MPKIHQLSETLSNQIAAGEVIERPASVVKELIENSLDARATQVDVVISEAGLKKIEVSDNGMGIEAIDVPTAFLRHATSKILTTKDLFKVQTLGFRGEALASIAAIAHVTLTTATTSGLGTQATVKGGQIEAIASIAHRQGTDVVVEDLFFNTPARLKYVKSPQTELSRIVDIVSRLAMAHPEVAFSLKNGTHTLLKTSGQKNLQQTIAGIYGTKVAKTMVDFANEDLDFTISGFTSLPETTRASRNYLSIMINGRYIKNFQLTRALIAGYGSKLMVGRYPMGVLQIKMDPLLVDVNVHPTKAEVRLSKEEQLADLIQTTIALRLASENLIPDALDNLTSHAKTPKPEATSLFTPTIPFVKERDVHLVIEPQATETVTPVQDTGLDISELDDQPIANDPEKLAAWDAKYAQLNAPVSTPTKIPEPQVAAPDPAPRFPDLMYLAQVHGTYLLAQAEDGLYIVDQHAAQERVNYEYYRQAIGQVSEDQQRLLVPIVLDYATTDAIAIRSHVSVLETVGLYLEDFGQNSFVVRQHPTWFKAGQEEETIKEMIDWVIRDGKLTVAAFREKTAIMMSCRRAIKANHHLDDKQAQALLAKLPDCENPFNCPHGRPVLVHFSNTDLEKMFKRIQDSHESGAMQE